MAMAGSTGESAMPRGSRSPNGRVAALLASGRREARPGRRSWRATVGRTRRRQDARRRTAGRSWWTIRADEPRAAEARAALSPDEVESYAGKSLYDPAVFRTLFLDFEDDDWESELADFKETDVEVPATLTVDGDKYPNVGVKFRGMSSFMMVPAGFKRSLNLSLDFIDEDQRLDGYKTLNLLNCNGDPSMMSTVLYSQIAREHIPTPKANFVRVVINGECWGVYANAQQIDKIFIEENFGSSKGTRWKVPGSPGGDGGLRYLGDDIEEYKSRYEIKSNDDEEGLAGARRVVPRAERDARRTTRGETEADPRHRRCAVVPRARQRAGQQRRLLDAGQRLLFVPRRARRVPRDSERHERSVPWRRTAVWRPRRFRAAGICRSARRRSAARIRSTAGWLWTAAGWVRTTGRVRPPGCATDAGTRRAIGLTVDRPRRRRPWARRHGPWERDARSARRTRRTTGPRSAVAC